MTQPRSYAKRVLLPLALILAPILFFLISLCIGRYGVSIGNVLAALWQGISGQHTGISSSIYSVVVDIRLPRAFLAAMVGGALASSGAAFQSLFRNPLVSAGILGVSSGAGFGAALSILLFSSLFVTPLFAFGFGVLAVVLSYLIGKISNTSSAITLVLGGTIVQSIFSAALSLVKYVADANTQLPAITFWLMGSLASTKQSDILFSTIPMVIGMAGLVLLRWRLNVLSMGDREARTLGIGVSANKFAVVGCATLATAGAVCVSGVVGWIGLVVPHIARMLVGNNNRSLIPASISIGACFVMLVDLICRTLTSGEIPLSVVSALVGGPFFVYLLKKTKARNW